MVASGAAVTATIGLFRGGAAGMMPCEQRLLLLSAISWCVLSPVRWAFTNGTRPSGACGAVDPSRGWEVPMRRPEVSNVAKMNMICVIPVTKLYGDVRTWRP
jgi:hypothetical protein